MKAMKGDRQFNEHDGLLSILSLQSISLSKQEGMSSGLVGLSCSLKNKTIKSMEDDRQSNGYDLLLSVLSVYTAVC